MLQTEQCSEGAEKEINMLGDTNAVANLAVRNLETAKNSTKTRSVSSRSVVKEMS
jgi:hypothetical protein